MTAEVALSPFWYALTALSILLATLYLLCGTRTNPCNQDILRQRCVGVFDLDEGELDAAI